jgi:hypothetical protein
MHQSTLSLPPASRYGATARARSQTTPGEFWSTRPSIDKPTLVTSYPSADDPPGGLGTFDPAISTVAGQRLGKGRASPRLAGRARGRTDHVPDTSRAMA